MIAHGVRAARAALLVAALAAAPGCTAFDDYLPGSPFTLEQPQAEVTLVGELHADAIPAVPVPTAGCVPGLTVIWGSARNTGDVDLSDVSIVVDVFDGGGALLGSFEDSVFNGEIADDDAGNTIFGTNLEVDQGGTFNVCTTVPFGAVARADYQFRFVVIDPVER